MLKPIVLGACLILPCVAQAADPSPAAQREITHLLDYLGNSGCDFYRNGSWHPATEARAHVATKYNYLLRRGWVNTAEDFIARAASKSSMSGSVYRVRCPGAPPVASGAWLSQELSRYRARK